MTTQSRKPRETSNDFIDRPSGAKALSHRGPFIAALEALRHSNSNPSTSRRLSSSGRSLPGRGNFHDAGGGLSQICYRRSKGEAHEMLARGAERGSGDGGHSGILQQDAANFFGAGARTTNVDPGVERTIGKFTAESRDLIQVMDELFSAAGELGHHARRGALAIA